MHILLFIQTMILLVAAAFIIVLVRYAKKMLHHYGKLIDEHKQLRKDFDLEREMHDGLLDEVIRVIPDEKVRADFQGAMTLGRLNAGRKRAEDS